MEIFEFGKSPSKTVFAKLQSGFSYEFKLGAEEKPRSAGEREKRADWSRASRAR